MKPLAVVNPYARELTFLDSQTRTRRDHLKYLTLIRSVALLHQYQRPIQRQTHHGKTVEYIESTREDIDLARRLVNEVLVRSLDELPPQTRRLLLLLDERVSQECQQLKIERSDFRFSRRDVRHHTGWNDSQLKKHLHRLEDLEYLIVHRGGRGQSFVYELYSERDAESGQPVLPGLSGSCEYDAKKSRPESHLSPSSHGQVTGVARGGHGEEQPVLMRVADDFSPNLEKITSGALGENRVVFTPTVVAAADGMERR